MSDTITTAALLSESEAERKRTLAVLDLTAAQRDKFIAGYRRLHAGIEALADECEEASLADTHVIYAATENSPEECTDECPGCFLSEVTARLRALLAGV